jgi:glycosyltransferase involved in cell wall biosynthesis
MQENKKKILFIFNQLTSGTRFAGGEKRGLKLFQLFSGDPEFVADALLPKTAEVILGGNKGYFVGENRFEKYIYRHELQGKMFVIFVLYFLRTLESLKYIVRVDADVIYSTGDFFCDTLPAFFIKVFHPKIKWVCCVHHINDNPFERKQVWFVNSVVSFVSQRLSFLLLRISGDSIFAINGSVRDYLVNFGIPQKKILVVGNGMTISGMDLLREQNKPEIKENKISMLGRLSTSKGVFDLPEILSPLVKKYPDLRLEIIGSGEADIIDAVKEGFKKHGCLDNVDFLGYINDDDEAHIKLLPAKAVIFPTYEEGWGLVLFETVLLKIPVVAYRLPIFEELFKGNILSAEIGNKAELAEKILFCLDPSNSREISERVEKCYEIARRFDWKDVFNSEKQSIQLLL